MGKKNKSQVGRVGDLPEYEKQRLNNLKINASRMEAAGLGSFANKFLISKYDSIANKVVCSEDMESEGTLNEDIEYLPNQEDVAQVQEMDQVHNFTLGRGKENDPSKKGERQPLHQRLSMVEFAKLRSRKSQQLPLQEESSEHQPKSVQKNPPANANQKGNQQPSSKHCLTVPAINNQNPSQGMRKHQPSRPLQELSKHQPQSAQQNPPKGNMGSSGYQQPTIRHQLMVPATSNKKPTQGTSKQKPSHQHQQYCAPGSMNLYSKLRLKQQERQHGLLSNVGLPTTTNEVVEVNENDFSSTSPQALHISPRRSTSHDVQGSRLGSDVNVLPQDPTDNQHEMENECQVDDNQDSIPGVARKNKTRGPTLMAKVHRRTLDDRQIIVLNELLQPFGPSRDAVIELRNFLGTLAKDPELAPLNILDWKFMPTKENIWSYVKDKYIIPDEGKKWVLETVNADWRVYKTRLKSLHYKAYNTYEERWANRPTTIPDAQFKDLLDYWDSLVGQETSRVNASNRQKYEDVHTMGPISLAMLRYELEQKDTNKQPPSESVVYKQSRKRKATHVYKTDGFKTKENIEKMNVIELQIKSGERNDNVDPYSEVIAKERGKRMFLQGRGVTMSALKSKEKKGGYILDKEFFQNMKEEWTQEVAPILALEIISRLQAANPHMNLVIPNFTGPPESSDQLLRKQNLHSDVETRPSPQDVDNVEVDFN